MNDNIFLYLKNNYLILNSNYNFQIIETEKNVPQVICSICVEKLWSAYSFTLQIERIDNIINGIDDNEENFDYMDERNLEDDNFIMTQKSSDVELGTFFNKETKPNDSLDLEVDKILNMVQNEVEKGAGTAVDITVLESLENKVQTPIIPPDILKKDDIGSPLLNCEKEEDENSYEYLESKEKNDILFHDNNEDCIMSEYDSNEEIEEEEDEIEEDVEYNDEEPEEDIELTQKILKEDGNIEKPPECLQESILQTPVSQKTVKSFDNSFSNKNIVKKVPPKSPIQLIAVEDVTHLGTNLLKVVQSPVQNNVNPVTSTVNSQKNYNINLEKKNIPSLNSLVLKSVDPEKLAPPKPTVSLMPSNDFEDIESCEDMIPTYKIELVTKDAKSKSKPIVPPSVTIPKPPTTPQPKSIISPDIQYNDFFNNQVVVLLKNCKKTTNLPDEIINHPPKKMVKFSNSPSVIENVHSTFANQPLTVKPVQTLYTNQPLPTGVTVKSSVTNQPLSSPTIQSTDNNNSNPKTFIAPPKTTVNKFSPITCNICQSVFVSQIKYLQHLFNMHTVRSDQFVHVIQSCKMCNETFEYSDLRNHKCIFVNNSPRYTCTVCNRTFITQNALTLHAQSHTVKKVYTCDLCHKRCISQYQYKNHMNTHNELKKEICDLCNQEFPSIPKLEAHKR